jgi:hypothetical protein
MKGVFAVVVAEAVLARAPLHVGGLGALGARTPNVKSLLMAFTPVRRRVGYQAVW